MINRLDYIDELVKIPEFATRIGVKFERAGLEGKIVGCSETISNPSNETSQNSLTMNRQLGSKMELVRGRAGLMPFAPGGLDLDQKASSLSTTGKLSALHRDQDGLFDVAPGLSRGLLEKPQDAVADKISQVLEKDSKQEQEQDEENEREASEDANGLLLEEDQSQTKSFEELLGQREQRQHELDAIDELLPRQMTFARPDRNVDGIIPKKRVKEWAHIVDVNKEIANFSELVPNPAKEYPFELDTFQKEAVYHLEQGDSVFVAAHTSAGKTAIAEYAISLANRNMTKTVYTSPIKALSNQKYRDFKDVYDDVGILTGDVQINPEASCLIMTTEILRSMLYRGADLIRDVEFVIFDEVHYVNDQDRGVVWEEVIIMLPEHVKLILLSATVPNTFEFANWIGRTKQKDIYVISTAKRPVPLEYYLWAKAKTFKVVDSDKKLLESGYKQAQSALQTTSSSGGAPKSGNQSSTRGGSDSRGGRGAPQLNRGGARGGRGGARGRGGGGVNQTFQQGSGRNINYPGKTDLTQLCQHLNRQKLLPAVIFVFSKKRCEQFAIMLNTLDFCSAKEKSEIHMFIDKAVSRLKKEDRTLSQIMLVRDLLSRGIGIHHGGLLPIMKEVVEILFAKSLVKVLFATETFAMGLNLPTKTVVFASTRKHDGHSFRDLLPGEFTQMAGRAGRRGLDPIGTVILMTMGQVPPLGNLRNMILGQPTKLQSQFRLTYNMILNLLRVEALRVEDMIKRSFSENSTQVLLPQHEKDVKALEEKMAAMSLKSCNKCDPDINEAVEKLVAQDRLSKEILTTALASPIGRRFVCRGRVIVYTRSGRRELGIITGITYATKKMTVLRVASAFSGGDNNGNGEQRKAKGLDRTKEKLNATLPFLTYIREIANLLLPFSIDNKFVSTSIEFNAVDMVTAFIVKQDVSELVANVASVVATAKEQLAKFLRYQAVWSECDLSRVRDAQMNLMIEERAQIIKQISQLNCIHCPDFLSSYLDHYKVFEMQQQIDSIKQLISDQNMDLLPDYEQRISVLRELNYVDDSLNVLLKGRVACEIATGFELVVTELILDNFLAEYEPEEIVALLSAFVFEGNTEVEGDNVTPRLDRGKARIQQIFNVTNGIFEKYQVSMTQEEADFCERKRFGLMEVVYEWARGMTFSEITGLTDVQEGSIVRVITRMDEVCREVIAAARIVGDVTLGEKMQIAQEKIKRDIVFCASLYV